MPDENAKTASAPKIRQRVEGFCRQNRLFSRQKEGSVRVCAAVSGGADSMALLLLLQELAGPLGFVLTACHVNHGLRGAAARRDEEFVRAECARRKIPLRVFRAEERGNLPARPSEDWARALRYGCFEQLHEEGIDWVATAHTVTDQAETLLFRLARGTGLHGAAGIRPVRQFYARPLLCLTRAETEGYCRALGQSWVEDETNHTDGYARNRLRRHALPALRQANEAAEQNLARFCERAARADEYFDRMASQLLAQAARQAEGPAPGRVRAARAAGEPVFALEAMRRADPLILERAMHRLVSPVRDPEEKYIRLLCALVQRGGGAVQLREDLRYAAAGGFLWQESEKTPVLPPCAEWEEPFFPQREKLYCLPGGYKLENRLVKPDFPEKIQLVHKKDLKNQADYARITMLHSRLVLRARRPGDWFCPPGRGVRKALRKWMNEAAVPPRERDVLPLLADGSEIVWIYGAGFADGLAPNEDTEQILLLDEKREDAES